MDPQVTELIQTLYDMKLYDADTIKWRCRPFNPFTKGSTKSFNGRKSFIELNDTVL